MCGRFAQKKTSSEYGEIYEAVDRSITRAASIRAVRKAAPTALGPALNAGAVGPSYNIAPSQPVPVIRIDPKENRRVVDLFQWGLVPSWAKDPSIGARMINARSETIVEKPSYKNAFKSRRCLVPADGYYEWKKSPQGKIPHFIGRPDGRTFGMAGIWEHWEKELGVLDTFSILTREAEGALREIHERMPVIIPQDLTAAWLDAREHDEKKLLALLGQPRDFTLEAYPVSPYVNRPEHNDASCLSRVSLERALPGS